MLIENDHEFYLIEEFLYFKQYKFHKQKIAFHRASMKAYESYLLGKGKAVKYIESSSPFSDSRAFKQLFDEEGVGQVHVIDPVDDWLIKQLRASAMEVELQLYDTPQFLNSTEELSSFFRPDKKSFFQTSFYKQQRKQRNILLDDDGEPVGGEWTFDTDNRKKYPKNKMAPAIHYPEPSQVWEEAVEYTNNHFSSHFGSVSKDRYYPINFDEAQEWLDQFLVNRFMEFGDYEDAIVKSQSLLNHSLLSPLLNSGLLLPDLVLEKVVRFAKENDIPVNSTEGFVRQLIGWREFIRGMYECKGGFSRTKNFWGFHRKIPSSFYTGTTGVAPIDATIKKVLKTGYCHHIERLMVLGNFMLLCEFDPDEVYRWFMELFIDAYDWVMVPNVYGMTLFADGGTFATKPYIGGANYIRKMSDYPGGDWETTWNALFWNFVSKHSEFFRSNPRTGMMVTTYKRMSAEKKEHYSKSAATFLAKLDA